MNNIISIQFDILNTFVGTWDARADVPLSLNEQHKFPGIHSITLVKNEETGLKYQEECSAILYLIKEVIIHKYHTNKVILCIPQINHFQRMVLHDCFDQSGLQLIRIVQLPLLICAGYHYLEVKDEETAVEVASSIDTDVETGIFVFNIEQTESTCAIVDYYDSNYSTRAIHSNSILFPNQFTDFVHLVVNEVILKIAKLEKNMLETSEVENIQQRVVQLLDNLSQQDIIDFDLNSIHHTLNGTAQLKRSSIISLFKQPIESMKSNIRNFVRLQEVLDIDVHSVLISGGFCRMFPWLVDELTPFLKNEILSKRKNTETIPIHVLDKTADILNVSHIGACIKAGVIEGCIRNKDIADILMIDAVGVSYDTVITANGEKQYSIGNQFSAVPVQESLKKVIKAKSNGKLAVRIIETKQSKKKSKKANTISVGIIQFEALPYDEKELVVELHLKISGLFNVCFVAKVFNVSGKELQKKTITDREFWALHSYELYQPASFALPKFTPPTINISNREPRKSLSKNTKSSSPTEKFEVHVNMSSPSARVSLPPSTPKTVSDDSTLIVHLVQAKGLANADVLGLSDPYAIVFFNGHEQARTKVIKNNLNPKWNEKVYVDLSKKSELENKIRIEVYDYDKMTHHDFLGQVELDLEQLHHSSTPQEFSLSMKPGLPKRKSKYVQGNLVLAFPELESLSGMEKVLAENRVDQNSIHPRWSIISGNIPFKQLSARTRDDIIKSYRKYSCTKQSVEEFVEDPEPEAQVTVGTEVSPAKILYNEAISLQKRFGVKEKDQIKLLHNANEALDEFETQLNAVIAAEFKKGSKQSKNLPKEVQRIKNVTLSFIEWTQDSMLDRIDDPTLVARRRKLNKELVPAMINRVESLQ